MANHFNILDGSHQENLRNQGRRDQERLRNQERRESRLWKILALLVALYGVYVAL